MKIIGRICFCFNTDVWFLYACVREQVMVIGQSCKFISHQRNVNIRPFMMLSNLLFGKDTNNYNTSNSNLCYFCYLPDFVIGRVR